MRIILFIAALIVLTRGSNYSSKLADHTFCWTWGDQTNIPQNWQSCGGFGAALDSYECALTIADQVASATSLLFKFTAYGSLSYIKKFFSYASIAEKVKDSKKMLNI